MNYKNKKRLQIINYIFNKLNTNELPKEFIGKLVYLSNKLFLLKYGCTITGDKFIAFERGTTCSESLALMDMDIKHVDGKDTEAIKTFKNIFDFSTRNKTQKVHTIFITNKLTNNFSTISEKEKSIIDIILQRFGNMREDEISNYTHKFLEWQNYDAKMEQAKLKQNKDAHITLEMDDVFNDNTFFEDEILSKYITKENAKIAYSIYNGDF